MVHIIKQISATSDDQTKVRFLTLESLSFLAFNIPLACGIWRGLEYENYKGLFYIAILLVVGTVYSWFQFVKSNGAQAHYLFGCINALIASYMIEISLYATLWGVVGLIYIDEVPIELIVVIVGTGALACGVVWLWSRTFVPKFQSYPGFVASIRKRQYETTDQIIMRDEEEGLVVLEL